MAFELVARQLLQRGCVRQIDAGFALREQVVPDRTAGFLVGLQAYELGKGIAACVDLLRSQPGAQCMRLALPMRRIVERRFLRAMASVIARAISCSRLIASVR